MSRRPAAAPALSVQRWPFSDDSGDSGGSGGGVLDWIGQKAGAASAAIGGAVESAGHDVGQVLGGAADWAKSEGSAAVGAVSNAGAGAAAWTRAKAAQIGAGLAEKRRLGALAQIASAQQRLAALGSLPVTEGQLAKLNEHLASLRAKSNGVVNVSGVGADKADGAEQSIGASTLAGVLAGLHGSLSAARPPAAAADPAPAQRKIHRFLDPATAAALEEVGTVVAETAEMGAVPALVAAPETAGISLVVLAIVLVVVAIVVAIIVFASTRPATPTPAPADEPEMPPGLSREKKAKWKDCQQKYQTYKKGTGVESASLASEIRELRGRYASLTPAEKKDLCAKVHQQLKLVEQLINDREAYIDGDCDEFDWFGEGRTAGDRKKSHEGQVDNVRAQEANLFELLRKLQQEGIC